MLTSPVVGAGKPAWLAYLVAVGSVVLATAAQLLLGRVAQQSPFLLFLGAIALTAWYGGLWPGLLASALAALAGMYFFLPPYGVLEISRPVAEVRLAFFVLVALLINVLSYTRSRAEARTVEQRERLRVTLASIGDGVLAVDTAGHVTFMNAVAEQLTAWPHAEAVGQHIHDVFRIVHEETRAPVENPVDRVLREGRVVGLANHTL